jgi:hypothetical protein
MAEKQCDWADGRVLNTERRRYFAGTLGGTNTNGKVDENGNLPGLFQRQLARRLQGL